MIVRVVRNRVQGLIVTLASDVAVRRSTSSGWDNVRRATLRVGAAFGAFVRDTTRTLSSSRFGGAGTVSR